MQWCDFYDAFWDWSDSTRRTRISSLEDIGSGDEVVEAVLEIEDPKVKAQLIRKAMKLGAEFSSDDFMNLDGELPDELYEELGRYTGFDHNDPYFDEDNMTWDDFECCYSDWNEELLARRIGKLNDFGDPESVCDSIMCMPSSKLEDALYERAIKKGVRFTEEQLENMGHVEHQLKNALDNFLTDDQIDQFVANAEAIVDDYEREKKKQKRIGFWGTVIGILSGINQASSRRANSHKCNGDCANCPPHYGYRYGRWYYGHGHMHGCERGGNGGASGRTYRD